MDNSIIKLKYYKRQCARKDEVSRNALNELSFSVFN